MSRTKIKHIPTHLITGFLGVGKTSTILHLMSQKLANEKWSVLVNEFGSVGIDGAIYQSQDIEVKEIPGGCMCCAAGVPLQVAVNQILTATQPQRLLIEPSGLGHPKRVLDTLQGQYFKESLDLRATFCLVDPRNLSDIRYSTHENFIDQIMLADILVANKSDLCDSDTLSAFHQYAESLQPPKCAIIETQFGQVDAGWLNKMPLSHQSQQQQREAVYPNHHQRSHNTTSLAAKDDGYKSIGYSFPQETRFSFDKLTALLTQLNHTNPARIKALFNTDKGWKVFNIHNDQEQVLDINTSADNRFEIIYSTRDIVQNTVQSTINNSDENKLQQDIHQQLRTCVIFSE